MQTLKLDNSYRPIQIIDAFDAFSMVWMDRACLVESYDNQVFRSTHDVWEVPCVIAIKRYINLKRFTPGCNRKNILWRDQYRCQYCGNVFSEDKLTLDHVIPRSRGGLKTWNNIVTSCIKCNQKKGAFYPNEIGMFPLEEPTEPHARIFQLIDKDIVHKKWLPYLKGIKLN